MDQLGLLLCTGYRRTFPAVEMDRLYLREDYASLPPIADQLGIATGGPDLRGAARLALAAHPALTGGLVAAWMGPGGKGRSLTALWIATLRRAGEEMAASPRREETPYLVALGLAEALQGAVGRLNEILPRPPHDRWLRAAAVTGLWVSARTGILRFARDAGLRDEDPLRLRMEAAVNASTLAGGRGGLQGGGSTLYGPELLAGIPRADDVGGLLSAGGAAEAAVAAIASALASDDEGSRRAETAVALWKLRGMLLESALSAEEGRNGGSAAELRALLTGPGALAQTVADEDARAGLATRLSQGMGGAPSGGGAAALEQALCALRAWKAREPAAAVGLLRGEARQLYALAAAGVLADLALERVAAPVRQVLVPPAGAGTPEMEWEAGRLYQLSARPTPILLEAREQPIAHLFADVKDFTRRTGLLGPAAMGEFLRREFYLPILAAARDRSTGMDHLPDGGGVTVNNLLGDAISFSGDIEALVELATEIRRLLAAYQARLEREVSSSALAGRLAALEERFRAGIASADAARDLARADAERAPAGSGARAEAHARAALHAAAAKRLSAEREQEVARTRGEGLEAGVFVSFGPAPLVISIDDAVFGRNRVAIADKINESARGTARAGPALARADDALDAARSVRGTPGLRHAWSVFIGQPLSLPVPPDAAAEVLRAARAGDMNEAMRAVARPVRRAIEAAARADDEAAGDVYNAGAALSEEALTAWLAAVGTRRRVRRVEMDPRALPAELTDRWWFGDGHVSLVVTFHPDGRPGEMFRQVGRAWFRGLGEVPVWEMAAGTGGPAALFQAMGESWLAGRPIPSAGS